MYPKIISSSAGGSGSATLGSTSFNYDATPDNGQYGLLSGSVNGSNTVFTTVTGYISGSLIVFLNGIAQNPGDDYTETTPASGTFTFVSAPQTNDKIVVQYKSTTVATGNADTLDGIEGAAFAQISVANSFTKIQQAPLWQLALTLTVDSAITADYGVIVPDHLEIASGITLEIGSGAILEIT